MPKKVSTTIDPTRATTPLPKADQEKKYEKLIQRRHPLYNDLLAHWKFAEDTYDGGRDWFKGNIFRYIKEGEVEYNDRLKRAYRFNHTREVVDLINKYLFKQNIARSDDAPQAVQNFWLKATKSGLTIGDFSRQISKKTSIFGRIGIVVDTDKSDGNIISIADEKNAEIGAYAYIVTPMQILDYSFDDHGELNWILIYEQGRDDADPFDSSGKPIKRFRLWTRKDWTLFEIEEVTNVTNEVTKTNIKKSDSGTHDLNQVPVILADNIIGDEEYSSPALIDDIAYLDRAVANYLSNLDAIIQDQTFSQLAMPAQNLNPGDELHNKLLEMGTQRIFTYNGDGGVQPFYLSPDVKQADLIIQVVTKIIGEIYHTVGLAGERTKQDNAVGIDNSSGVAKAYDFERVNALLAAKADSLESIENKIARLVAKWHGVEIDAKTSYVSYPDNFDTRGLHDEFDIAARLMLVDAPDTVRREQMMAVIEKLFPQLKDDLKSKMIAELKKWPLDPLELQARISDTTGNGDLRRNSSVSNGASNPSETIKNSKGNEAKMKGDNHQGQVTKQTQ